MAVTPLFGLTMMASNSSGKEATFNEAVLILEIMASGVVTGYQTSPPGSPVDGASYVVKPTATGAWAGREGKIAYYYSGWHYVTPAAKQTVWSVNTSQFLRYNGATWDVVNATTVNDLSDLTDVTITSPTNGQVLIYNSSTGQWVNTTKTLASDLGALDDVDLVTTPPAEGLYLCYDDTTDRWVPRSFEDNGAMLSQMSDVDVAGREDGYYLLWDEGAGKHVYAPGEFIATVASLDDVGGVDTVGASPGNVLTYNGAAWVPGSAIGMIQLASDIAGDFTGNANMFLRVSEDEDYIEYHNIELSVDLTDVVVTSVDDNHILIWDDGAGYWKNVPAATIAGAQDLDGLDDVSVSGATDGQYLMRDSGSWVGATITVPDELDDFTDVDTTGKTTGDLLAYNGTGWIPTSVLEALPSATGNANKILALNATEDGIAWVEDGASEPVIVSLFAAGVATSSEELMRFPVVKAFDLTDMGGCLASAGTASAAPAAFDIRKNGTSVAEITFSSSDTGSFSGTGATFDVGDILTITAPITPDISLADIGIALKGAPA